MDHFFNSSTPGLENIFTQPGVQVTLPDGTMTQAKGTATMHIPALQQQCRTVHIFDEFLNSLLSIPKLCDHNYATLFTNNKVHIYDKPPIITQTPTIQAPRNKTTGLWELNLPKPQTANYAHKITTMKDKIKFYHQACGRPVTSTWINAIQNQHLITWRGLTVDV